MAQISPSIPVVGNPHSTEDPKVRNALVTIRNAINGNLESDNWADGTVDSTKLSNSLAKAVGVDNGSVTGRAYQAVATSQSTSSSSFTDLSTVGPSIVLTVPTNGFVNLYVEATLTPTSTGAALVGIYEATDYPSCLQVLSLIATLSTTSLASTPGSYIGVDSSAYGGGFITVPATAGTRTYTLKYMRSGGSGSVTFASRKLWGIAGGPA